MRRSRSLLLDVSRSEDKELKGHTGIVTSVAFSPDGKRILSGSWGDDTLRVWDAGKGSEIRTLTGHADATRSASYSPDGKRIVSGSEDTTLKVWDADKGTEVLTLPRNCLARRA
jgi:WD40 repeat protein